MGPLDFGSGSQDLVNGLQDFVTYIPRAAEACIKNGVAGAVPGAILGGALAGPGGAVANGIRGGAYGCADGVFADVLRVTDHEGEADAVDVWGVVREVLDTVNEIRNHYPRP
jgi:hypothetical protein